jgi:hypothetical protein
MKILLKRRKYEHARIRQLTNAREAAQPGTSTTTAKPGMQTHLDAFAALVPAEVLTLHALIISATTEIPKKVASGDGTVAVAARILPEAMQTLQYSFWGLVAASAALYTIPRATGGKWDKFDWLHVLIAPLVSQ